MPKESKSIKGVIHYEIAHDKRNLKLKPYRKIVFRILSTHEKEFREKLSIPEDQKFKVDELKQRHPEITKIVTKYNRPHHQVDYSGFKNNNLGKNDYVLNLPEIYLLEDD